jgi:hypothetical protein
MSIAVLRQMFEQMVEKKDPTAIDRYYHPSFVMFSNGVTQDFEAFAASHRTIYATPISYSVAYDEQAWVESPERSPAACGSRRAAQARAPLVSRSC